MEKPTQNKYDMKPNGSKSNVIQLKNSNIKNNKVTHKEFKNHYGILKVYAPWCGYCTQMVDDINFIADELKSEGIVISALNYEQNKECCQKLGVSSFPSIYMVGNNGSLENVDNLLNDRSVESILDVICKKTNEYSNKLKGTCCRREGNKLIC